MGKVGKTFTLDLKVLAWLEEYSKKEKMKESTMVNSILNSVKKRSESWTCLICGVTNANDNQSCYTLNDGEFCEGVKLDLNMTLEESRKKLRSMGVPEKVIK